MSELLDINELVMRAEQQGMKISGIISQGFGLVLFVPSKSILFEQKSGEIFRRALGRFGLLIIRSEPLHPEEQIEFTSHFGVVECLPWQEGQIPGVPKVFRVSSQAGLGVVDTGQTWHSDGAYLIRPREISVFHVVSQDEDGSITEFSSLHDAYDSASESLRNELSGKYSVLRDTVLQPVIREHPVTGRRGFYVKLSKSRRMQDTTTEDSERLYSAIEQLLQRDGAVYQHRWGLGDLLVADNFSVAHRAVPYDGKCVRILHRTTIVGGSRKR
jgi:taurine dioxygenase